jgi:hypothetical protein
MRFIAKPYVKTTGGRRDQWVIPLDALSLRAKTGVKVPFNAIDCRGVDWIMVDGVEGPGMCGRDIPAWIRADEVGCDITG